MLTKHIRSPRKQRGMILLMTLVVLVIMTLAAVALTRSADTSGFIAGNVAFRQSVIQSADLGIEAAVTWLEANNTVTALSNNATASGYTAVIQDPASGQSWGDFWDATLSTQAVTLAEDSAGNTVSYAIQRLCDRTGEPNKVNASGVLVTCQTPPASTGSSGSSGSTPGLAGSTMQVGGTPFSSGSNQVYYRITVRIDGPRNTLSYVQSIVAM